MPIKTVEVKAIERPTVSWDPASNLPLICHLTQTQRLRLMEGPPWVTRQNKERKGEEW